MFAYNLMLSKGFVNTSLSSWKYCYTVKIIQTSVKEDSKYIFKKRILATLNER